jgi:hypothetical protein
MHSEANGKKTAPENDQAGPDYDDLPHGDFNPMWDVAIGIGALLICLAAIIAFS